MFHVHPKRSHILLLLGAEFCNCLILLVDGVNSEIEYFVVVVLVVVCFCFCFLFLGRKREMEMRIGEQRIWNHIVWQK